MTVYRKSQRAWDQESELCARCVLNPEATMQGSRGQKSKQALCLRQNLLDVREQKVRHDLLKGSLFRMSPVKGFYHWGESQLASWVKGSEFSDTLSQQKPYVMLL